ncbi:MAG: response regulator transcription factor [Corynebacterium sp.]|uniref:response regulator n=1 Tax=Corynebacterium sp. TaxID=1720 RepID=UPI0026DC63F9|nr:response regulator transcription factor [Corynebacterium sp.]MDO5098780.1 response regulator transcription factor [Corynebacterium sp.]
MSTERIKIVIVDDDRLARETLTKYFSPSEEFDLVGVVKTGHEVIEIIENQKVDVILSDIYMPAMSGLTLLEKVLALKNPPRFIAITSIDDDDNMIRVLGRGGAGYILKSQSPKSIIQAVRDAVDGGMVVSPTSVENLIREVPKVQNFEGYHRNLLDQVVADDSPLNPEEKKVLKLLCSGMSNAEIASHMLYSESSIKKRVSSLMQDFGAKSRLDLVVALLNKPENVS